MASLKKRSIWKSAAARRLLKIAGDPSSVEDAVRIVASRFLEGVSCPPTDLDAMRSRLNITGFFPEDIPISGELRRDGNGFKIIFSSYLSPERKRFTIAHEIGHAIFETTDKNCPRVGTELERLCDMLATEIVMPKHIFLSSINGEISLKKVFLLAKKFQTSLSATAIRFAELLGISAFEVENNQVSWSYGVVKKGPLIGMEHDLKCAVENAIANKISGGKAVFLHNAVWKGLWNLEWASIGQNGRMLFLLQPVNVSLVEAKQILNRL